MWLDTASSSPVLSRDSRRQQFRQTSCSEAASLYSQGQTVTVSTALQSGHLVSKEASPVQISVLFCRLSSHWAVALLLSCQATSNCSASTSPSPVSLTSSIVPVSTATSLCCNGYPPSSSEETTPGYTFNYIFCGSNNIPTKARHNQTVTTTAVPGAGWKPHRT